LIAILSNTVKTKGVAGLYSGSGALIAGNGLKAGVRFMTYDSVKDLFRGSDVSVQKTSLMTGQTVYNRQHVVWASRGRGGSHGGCHTERNDKVSHDWFTLTTGQS
jgi:solute carrier family 25 citrate transporter 1